MDFIEGLPIAGGYNTIFVIVDRLSKYAHFTGLKHPFTAKTVAEVFLNKIVRLHEYSKSTVLDRDKICLSHFWKELLCAQNRGYLGYIGLNSSTTLHFIA